MSCIRMHLHRCAWLLIGFLGTVDIVSAAESGNYTPPGGTLSVDSLMESASNSDYGLSTLMAQQSKSGESSSNRSASKHAVGTSILVGMGASSGGSEAAARKVLRAENRKLKRQLTDSIAELKSSQTELEKSRKQLSDHQSVRVEVQKQKDTLQKQLSDHRTLLTATQHQFKEAQTQLEAVRKQFREANIARMQLETALVSTRYQLVQANDRAVTASKSVRVPLDSDNRKRDYVVGQAMASGLKETLTSYAESGLSLDPVRVTAGLTDGLRNRMQLKRSDMDKYYLTFAEQLQKQVNAKVKMGEALIAKKTTGRKPAKKVNGLVYFVVKKGHPIKDQDAPVSLALSEQIVDGATLSTIPTLTLTADDDIPAVVREALPLLGEEAEVDAYALAKVVYGNLPMPKGVTPFTVLVYHLKGIKPQ
ncbi:FKBP-type peptidyl-prolyl cis-trans isomerase N-terminal domain-containing protein [Photorhabdus bodei]|uniref:FKBP-type peptidyl-prolyl cis-trans isomerase N-terminal domain-containing protein n=1 Tax=Photorhabdus bodei TaxID=2029681 RepID=UPI002330657D|nr:FKBP-type peptidyl-prolyl cis-trans isomerase N-terminal domain-containing protein [Photorhabdus bodei]MDB6369148.1 FKBP-type peptidyl-prolyl cis-trans isomerase N-terminal domain-containing protein [Photorhabdus bodei]